MGTFSSNRTLIPQHATDRDCGSDREVFPAILNAWTKTKLEKRSHFFKVLGVGLLVIITLSGLTMALLMVDREV